MNCVIYITCLHCPLKVLRPCELFITILWLFREVFAAYLFLNTVLLYDFPETTFHLVVI